MGSKEIPQEEVGSGIGKGDIVKVKEPEYGTKANSGWNHAMNNTPGHWGVVKQVSQTHRLVKLDDGRAYWYIPSHLKKAKKWQQRKYAKRSLSLAI